jgi:hypothetical protein
MSKQPVDFSDEGKMQQHQQHLAVHASGGVPAQMLGNQGLMFEAAFAQEKQRQFLMQQLQGQMFSNAGGANSFLQAASASNQAYLNNLMMIQQRANNFGGFNAPPTSFGNGGLDSANATRLTIQANPNNGLSSLGAPPPQPPRQTSGYRDASIMPDPVIFKSNGIDKNGRRGGTSEHFPQKLHRMLSELQKEAGGTDVASFLPHGRAFDIHNPKKFVTEIMPKYFRMSRFSSFQRQLNLYDFRRITDGMDKGAYYHELFLNGRPALCMHMKRTKIKGQTPGGWMAERADAGGYREGLNFYSMPPIQEAKPVAAVPEAPTIQNRSDEE